MTQLFIPILHLFKTQDFGEAKVVEFAENLGVIFGLFSAFEIFHSLDFEQ
jgi:hypothetical protein